MSRIDVEPVRESGRTVTVVGLSLLILTVIGALFGYVLGLRDIDENKSASGDGPSAVPPAAATSAANAARPRTCPQFVSAGALKQDPGASVPMQLVQYVRTGNNKEAWICREKDGSGLWYQGHDRIANWADEEGGEIPEEGRNGLLRPGASEDAKSRSYSVTNDGTTYTVTPRSLVIGSKTYGVIQAYPPA
ncbi:hypothetical protein ACQP1P_41290 [Dactylosporangium sp. CA-052675]|uniref:hypothetical protein n=1 Tax=Dactylosporangium sp. CA-052675 TaxID=3239927 RepID=UPI003D93B03F